MLRGSVSSIIAAALMTGVAAQNNPQMPAQQTPPPGQTPSLNQPNGPPPYLTLEQALTMARQRNGDVKAEGFNVQAADAAAKQAYGAFFPTLNVQAGYTNDIQTGAGAGGNFGSFSGSGSNTNITAGANSSVAANWEILDAGEREDNFLSARRALQAEQANFAQTIRQIEFTAAQDFFNALRAQELLKVDAASVQRAQTILDQTQSQVQVGDAPQKDILQARADLLNAKVQELTDQNASTSAFANLKAIIGWDKSAPLPTLQTYPEPPNVQPSKTLENTIQEGLQNRPDLISQRFQIQSKHYAYLSSQEDSLATLNLTAQGSASFSPNVGQDRQVGLQVVFPLYDGGILRERARQAHVQEFGAMATLEQRERDARAAIETDYVTVTQNAERVQAAKLALDAATLNYNAESDAQRLGAQNSTIVTVLTAQVSLVTAESAYVQAIYDYYISDAQLRLDTGRPMPGEAGYVPNAR